MNESKVNFGELKRLLKLKRYEVPPPGYFNSFSDDVIARIRAGEAKGAQNFLERLNEHVPWLVDLLRIFETKPGVIGGFAVSLCALLLVAVLWPESRDSGQTDAGVLALSGSATAAPAMPELTAAVAPAENGSGISVTPRPVSTLQPMATLFGQPQNPLFQPASFTPATHQ